MLVDGLAGFARGGFPFCPPAPCARPCIHSPVFLGGRHSLTIGTPPDVLAETLRRHYGERGLDAKLRYFDTVAGLKGRGYVLAVIKFDFMEDHYVTILDVTNTTVVTGDPLNGLTIYSHADFAKIWRYSGIVLDRAR